MGVLAGGGVGGEAAAVRGGGGGRVEVGGDRAQPALRGVVHWRRGLLVLPCHWRWTPCVAWGGGEVELRKRTRNTRVFSREGESLSVAIKALGLGASDLDRFFFQGIWTGFFFQGIWTVFLSGWIRNGRFRSGFVVCVDISAAFFVVWKKKSNPTTVSGSRRLGSRAWG